MNALPVSPEYMQRIKSNIIKNIPPGTNKNPLLMKQSSFPTIADYKKWLEYNHTVPKLKEVLTGLKLLVGGSKQELRNRIFIYFSVRDNSTKIQKIVRGFLVRNFFGNFRKFNSLKSQCVNDTDFYTFEPLSNIPYFQMVVLTTPDNKSYGFNISSLHKYITYSAEQIDIENPYTRTSFPQSFINFIMNISENARKYGVEMKNEEESNITVLSFKQKVNARAIKLFHEIDLLGNYTDPKWYLDLNESKLIRLLDELFDIWAYRSQASIELKQKIYPPHGMPFTYNIPYGLLTRYELLNKILELLERFVYFAVDLDSKKLGAFYVLGALTIVNNDAAEALPWLYDTFCL